MESSDEQQPRGAGRRRGGVKKTVAILAVTAALIYLGFIARGVLGA